MRKEWWYSMLKLGQKIIRAIEEHDEQFYQNYIEKYTEYPDEEDDKYYDENYTLTQNLANYDNDVDIAEMVTIINLLSNIIVKHRRGEEE